MRVDYSNNPSTNNDKNLNSKNKVIGKSKDELDTGGDKKDSKESKNSIINIANDISLKDKTNKKDKFDFDNDNVTESDIRADNSKKDENDEDLKKDFGL